MSEIEAIVDQYFNVWNERDADRRLALAEKTWVEDSRYVDPISDVHGPQGFTDMVGALQQQFPDHTVKRTSGIDQHHDQIRFLWQIVAPDGNVAFAGIDVGELAPDGRLRSISGFLGDLPTP